MISALLVLVALFAPKGVDQGNPKGSFYNMSHGYRLVLRDGDLRPELVKGSADVRVDVVITYRAEGHFQIAAQTPTLGEGETVCAERAIAGSAARAYWIGRDCLHLYFISKWEALRVAVAPLSFPQLQEKAP